MRQRDLRTWIAIAGAALAVSLAAAQPVAPVRVVAEWEPAVGTLITWPLGIPQALVQELARDDLIYVVVTGPSAESQARQLFDTLEIAPDHVEFIESAVQTKWTRDWGPHQIFDGNGQWAVVDPIFEGYPWVPVQCQEIDSPGGHTGDDAVNADVAAHFGAPLHAFPGYLTGGNFLVDGNTAAFSTCAMVGENEQLWTDAEFSALLDEFLGVQEHHVVGNTEKFGIQHIDCWVKPLDDETLLIKRAPTTHEEYPRIQANLAELALLTTRYGRPYRFVRIDTPAYDGYNVAAYANSLILNGKILVPQFGIPGDAAAIATFEAAMPGYEVVGFPWGSWYYYDALHCRVRAIFDRYMLRLTHRRLPAWVPAATPQEVAVFVDDRSEAGLVAEEVRVFWREAGSADWSDALLVPTATPDVYAATIPAYAAGTTIDYYAAAADQSGRAESLPRTAPQGYYRFTAGCAPISIDVGRTELTWSGLSGATGYDVVRGDLFRLRAMSGNYTASVAECVANDHPSNATPHSLEPPAGRSYWYLVRAVGASGNGSYANGADCERTTLDARIDVSEAACP